MLAGPEKSAARHGGERHVSACRQVVRAGAWIRGCTAMRRGRRRAASRRAATTRYRSARGTPGQHQQFSARVPPGGGAQDTACGIQKKPPGVRTALLNLLLRLARGVVAAFLFRARGCERPGVVAIGCFCCRCFTRSAHSPPRAWLSSAGRALTWRCGWRFWCRLSVASGAGAPRQNICPAATGRILRRQDRAQ